MLNRRWIRILKKNRPRQQPEKLVNCGGIIEKLAEMLSAQYQRIEANFGLEARPWPRAFGLDLSLSNLASFNITAN